MFSVSYARFRETKIYKNVNKLSCLRSKPIRSLLIIPDYDNGNNQVIIVTIIMESEITTVTTLITVTITTSSTMDNMGKVLNYKERDRFR